jgi:hypothetical protein
MKKSRSEILVSEEEKKILEKSANNRDMTVSEYIRYRVFHNNPEISSESFVYETPAKDRHNFLNMAVLHDIYWMMYQHLSENKSDEEKTEFRNDLKLKTKNSITNYGYLKVAKDE